MRVEAAVMRKAIALVLVLLIAAAAWWYASPIWTLREMREAAQAHDAARLSRHVDYPALRTDLKADLAGYAMRHARANPQDAGANFAAALSSAFLGPVVDAVVSPQGVAAMFAHEDQVAKAGEVVPVKAGDHPVIERDDLDTFRVHGANASKGALVFRREGLSWKLAGVDLPQSGD
jgi:hypothetical protein